eukprot:362000-Chlamydomonas_euryale.AAC.8
MHGDITAGHMSIRMPPAEQVVAHACACESAHIAFACEHGPACTRGFDRPAPDVLLYLDSRFCRTCILGFVEPARKVSLTLHTRFCLKCILGLVE